MSDITGDLGLLKNELKDVHFVKVMDYDLDGDDDLLVCRNGQPRSLHLIENRIGQDNNWTGVQLRAPHGVNKSCIGARIYVWSSGVQRMREVYAGRGNAAGQQPFAMLFGLGSNTVIDSVTVAWPDAAGSTTTVHNPPVNRYLEITAAGLSVADASNDAVPGMLKLYPNPAKDFILVQVSNNEPLERIEVYDVLGRSVNQMKKLSPDEVTVYCNTDHLPQGQYLIQVATVSGRSFSGVFMKSR